MSTTDSASDRVWIETPRGNRVIGQVIGHEPVSTRPQQRLVVDVAGSQYRVDPDDVDPIG